MKPILAFARLVYALLKELSDETAYQRHLATHGLKHSGEAWRHFSAERFRTRFVRPRCC